MILYPVLAPVPPGLARSERVDVARRRGERALARSARLAGRPRSLEPAFPRDANRAPLPTITAGGTWHFSTTNTRGLVAALVAPVRVGVDAEWLDRPRIEAALAYFDPGERARLGLDARRGVLALWSAKEAVLKLTGIGIAGMGRLRLRAVEEDGTLALRLDGKTYRVRLFFHGEHVLSIAAESPAFAVRPDSLTPEVPA